jgi:hypothetical protein
MAIESNITTRELGNMSHVETISEAFTIITRVAEN